MLNILLAAVYALHAVSGKAACLLPPKRSVGWSYAVLDTHRCNLLATKMQGCQTPCTKFKQQMTQQLTHLTALCVM